MRNAKHLYRAIVAVLALSTGTLCFSAATPDKKARLVVDVKINGSGSASSSMTGEKGGGTTSQELHTSVTLTSNGVLETTNRNDIAGNSAQMEKQMREAGARQPGQAQMRERALLLQKQMMACNGSIGCINKISGAYAKESSNWQLRPVQGDERFLTYHGYQGCQSDFHARVDTSRQGTIPDVQGPVPFTEKSAADYHASAMDKDVLCNAFNYLVVDTKANRIHVTLGTVPIKGTHMRTEGGRNLFASNAATDLRLHEDAMAWVRSKLDGAPRSGKERTTIKLTTKPGETSSREGSVDVELLWRFEDL